MHKNTNADALRTLAKILIAEPPPQETTYPERERGCLRYEIMLAALASGPEDFINCTDVGVALHRIAAGEEITEWDRQEVASAFAIADRWRRTGQRQLPPDFLEWVASYRHHDARECTPIEGALIEAVLDALDEPYDDAAERFQDVLLDALDGLEDETDMAGRCARVAGAFARLALDLRSEETDEGAAGAEVQP